jgi:hypothetical protein
MMKTFKQFPVFHTNHQYTKCLATYTFANDNSHVAKISHFTEDVTLGSTVAYLSHRVAVTVGISRFTDNVIIVTLAPFLTCYLAVTVGMSISMPDIHNILHICCYIKRL